MAFDKILIFGNSGSGKSTLAKKLSETKQLAHLDLDTLAWLPVDPPERAPFAASRNKILEFTNQNSSWVIEGCYSDLLELIISSATEIIFLNLDISTCIENAKNRPWEPHKYETKESQDENLTMLIDWITTYKDRNDVFSYQAHVKLYNQFPGKKTMHTNNRH